MFDDQNNNQTDTIPFCPKCGELMNVYRKGCSKCDFSPDLPDCPECGTQMNLFGYCPSCGHKPHFQECPICGSELINQRCFSCFFRNMEGKAVKKILSRPKYQTKLMVLKNNPSFTLGLLSIAADLIPFIMLLSFGDWYSAIMFAILPILLTSASTSGAYKGATHVVIGGGGKMWIRWWFICCSIFTIGIAIGSFYATFWQILNVISQTALYSWIFGGIFAFLAGILYREE